MKNSAQLLRTIAGTGIGSAPLDRCGVRDVSDFREWLIELAEKAEQAETLEKFLSFITEA